MRRAQRQTPDALQLLVRFFHDHGQVAIAKIGQVQRVMWDVTVYGADTCIDTQRVLALLTQQHVRHLYLNVDRNQKAKALVQMWYAGAVRTPVVVMEMDGVRLVEPTDSELLTTLASLELIQRRAA